MALKRPWYRRALLVVPLGLVGVVLVGFLFAKVAGIRVALGGSGSSPIFEGSDSEAHYRAIDADRAENSDSSVEPSTMVPPTALASEAPASEAAAPEAPDVAEEPPSEVLGESIVSPNAGEYWSDFRGPGRAGIYDQQPINTDWKAKSPPEVWRQKIGGGYASMVIAEGKVFTIEQRRNKEVVAAYNFETGRQVWEHEWTARFEESLGGDGPRATPTWHDGKIYALGASGDLYCLNAGNGSVIWNRNILSDAGASNVTWGMSAAPLVVDDLVVLLPGGRAGKSVVAYDKNAGEIRWTSQNDRGGYTSPQIATLAGKRQLIIVSGERIFGANIADGELLWGHEWKTNNDANCAQPLIVDDEHVLVSSAYGHGAALVKITTDGEQFSASEVWFSRNMKNKFNPSILADGVVYGLDDGILAAVDVRTGERLWKGGRYGFGQLIYASGHLIVISEQGDLVLVKATPESHQELATFEAISGKTWNVPAMADGRLIVRNQTEMAAYDMRQ